MKKKILNALTMLTLVGVLALNVTVVLNDDAAAYLKWDVIGKILAQTSVSDSDGDDECTTTVTTSCYDAEFWNSDSGVFYARVCDNTKCARAYFDKYDDTGQCTYCN